VISPLSVVLKIETQMTFNEDNGVTTHTAVLALDFRNFQIPAVMERVECRLGFVGYGRKASLSRCRLLNSSSSSSLIINIHKMYHDSLVYVPPSSAFTLYPSVPIRRILWRPHTDGNSPSYPTMKSARGELSTYLYRWQTKS
jgi:hypothetical protein